MKALLFFLLIPTSVFAWQDDPYELFNSSSTMYNSSQIEIHSVNTDNDGMWKVCEKESRKRGFNGFPNRVYACSFWNEGGQHKCSIYIPKYTDMHQLGHEIRHCFYGAWHP